MKGIIINIINLIFICFGLQGNCQSNNLDFSKITKNTIESIVTLKNTSFSDLNSDKISSGGKIMNRELSIKNYDVKSDFIFLIKRIQLKSILKDAEFDIDTDNPFPSSDREKRITENYLQYISNPFTLELTNFNKFNLKKAPRGLVRKQWSSDIPSLNEVSDFSGIFMNNIKMNYADKIIDSIKIEKDNGFYINSYKFIEKDSSTMTLQLNGFYKKTDETTTVKKNLNNTIPQNGINLNADITINSMEYFGKIIVNLKLNIIETLELEINRNETIYVLDQVNNRQSKKFLRIENKIK